MTSTRSFATLYSQKICLNSMCSTGYSAYGNFILPFIKYKVAISELIIVNSGIITFICPTAPTFFHTSHTFLVADCNQRTCPALVRSNRTCPVNLEVQPCLARSLICSVQLSSTAQHIIFFLSQTTI